MNNILKLLFHKCRMKSLLLYVSISYVLLMLPIIYIGKYDKPSADDYGYGARVHHAWMQTHSLTEVFQGVLDTVESSYYSWQGTYASIFMMALNPAAFNYRGYKLVPTIMIFILTVACLALSYAIFAKMLHKKLEYWFTIGILLAILTIEKMSTIPSGLFWYNSAVHYTFMHSCMILLIAFTINLYLSTSKAKTIIYMVVCCFLAVASAGANYATCLMGMVIFISVIAWMGVYHQTRVIYQIPAILGYSIGLYFNITAPGNQHRQAAYVGMNPVDSILNSFKSAYEFIPDWMNMFTIILMIAIIPILWNALDGCNYNFRVPGIVLLYSFCLIATGFTSSYYSMGMEGISRTHNVIKITFQILLILNECYIIGYVKRLMGDKGKNTSVLPLHGISYIIATFLMFLTVITASNKAGTFTTYAAIHYLKTGEAAMHYNEYMEREAILTSEEMDVVLEPYQVKPWLIFISDVTTDPNNWENQGVAQWYGKNSVKLADTDK